MVFELKSSDNRILYSLEKSEMFPDYRSVLQEALAFGIDLNGLLVKNENIDNIEFNHFKINDVRFENCSMVNVQFIESEGESISFSGCNLNRIKFKRSLINEFKNEVDKYYPEWYFQCFAEDFPGDWINEACKYLERWKGHI